MEQKQHILVIEDEQPLSTAISKKLQREGFRVSVVKTGEEALAFLEEQSDVDLLWVDLMLPGMDGIELLKHVRATDQWKQIPVVVVSNVGSERVMAQARELELVSFFVKAEHRLSEIVHAVRATLRHSSGPKPAVT